MDRGLYIAAAGMLAEQVRQDQIASDLANAATPGYKSDRIAQRSFGQLLLGNRITGATVGNLGLGPQIDEVRTDLTQGAVKQTGEPLDVALEGPGFLAVRTPQGVRYTRDGQLALDAQRRLVTVTGYAVLDANGNGIQLPAGDPAIGADGTISVGGAAVARLGVVSLAGAQKVGDTLFAGTTGARPAGTTVQQGSLEESAANPAQAMIEMIVSLRAYEAGQRVLHALDDALQRGISIGGSGATS